MVAAIVLVTIPARGATPERKIFRQAPAESGRVRVRMVAQPWAATSTAQPQPTEGKRSVRFIGHFPGYAAAKRAANERLKKKLQQMAAGQTPATSPNAIASASVGIAFDGPNETDTAYIPPDPIIAAGPKDVVVAINDLLAIYDKTGVQQGGFQDLPTFFSSLGITGQIFDPRVIYDQADGRYILSVDDVDMTNFTSGDVLLAVSATSDPTGVWYKYAINFMGRDATNTVNTFPDFPGLGLSPTAVYLTTNQFEMNSQCVGAQGNSGCQFSDAWIKVIGLPELLSGGSTLNVTTFKNVQNSVSHLAFGIQPALSYGTPAAEFLVAADFYSNPGTTLNLFSITTSGTPTLTTTVLTVPSFSLPQDAQQGGSQNLIDTDDFRTLNAVWSNGSLWCGQNVGGNSGPAAEWYQIALTDLTSAALTQSGQISGVGSAYYPAISVEADGTATVAFSTSNSVTEVSAAYTSRASGDAAGTMRGYAVVKEGLGPYDEKIGNRWGDYSGISLDPSGSSFWTIVEYAGAPDPEFATEIAEISGAPSLEASPGTLYFGSILVGRASSPQTVTVTNISSNAVTLGTASVSGPNQSDFALSSDQCSGVTVAAGQSCTISVTFSPTQTGLELATLTLGDQDGEVVVGMSGSGIYASILNASPASVTFPDTVQQSASAPVTVTVTNTGNIDAQIANVFVYGAFAESNNCGTSLAAGASCQFQVTFYPTSASGFSGNLDVSSNAENSPLTIQLNGTGVTAPGAVPCPTALNFGNQVQNTASTAQTVVLTNTGSSTLSISGVATSGDFTAVSQCPTSLSPRASCTIGVTFTPTALGTESGTLSISDNAAGSPQVVALSGTGVSSTAAALARRNLAAAIDLGARSRAEAHAAAHLIHAARPLGFEPNVGQFRPGVQYVAHVPGYALGVTRTGLELEMPAKAQTHVHAEAKRPQAERLVRVRMRLAGASAHPHAFGVDELPGKANYFFGRDPRAWRTNVATYARVRMRDVYPGVDLVYYGNQRRLEYDFIVRPGASPNRIRLNFAGASKLRVDASGNLLLETRAGLVRFHKPMVYQAAAGGNGGGERVYRQGEWVLRGRNSAAFRLGPYDPRRALVIDPVLSFSTFLGGSSGGGANAVAVDAEGNVYVAGTTHSSDFPVTGNAFQKTCGTSTGPCNQSVAGGAGFVAKLSSDGSTLIYATYLSGSADMEIHALAVDSSGDAYVTGYTTATDFPVTTGALQTQCTPLSSTGSCMTPFVTKLDPTGSSLVYSTYLGGTPAPLYVPPLDEANGIAVDAAGDAFVGGITDAQNFPTTSGSFQPSDPMLAVQHGFVSELNPAGSSLVFSTYLGGVSNDQINAVALDSSGNVYVAGSTQSVNFPTTAGAFQRGLYSYANAFVTKFSPSGSLLFSTLLGGTQSDEALAIAVDGAGAPYVTGDTPTSSSAGDFPVTPGAWDPGPNFGQSVFVTKLHPAGCALEYSTFLSGPSTSSPPGTGTAIAVDNAGDAYVGSEFGGNMVSSTEPLPATEALQPDLGGSTAVTELNPAGSALLFSTPFGGSRYGWISGLALDAQDDLYVAGWSTAADFPAVNALLPTCDSCLSQTNLYFDEPFLARISPTAASGISLTRTSLEFGSQWVGITYVESVGLMNNQSVALNIQGVTVKGAGYSLPSSSTPCTGSIAPGAGCVIAVQFDPTATGSQTGTVTITDDAAGSPQQIALNGTGLADFYLAAFPQWSIPPTVSTTSLTYQVTANAAMGVPSFSGTVALSCTQISPAICTFSPANVAINGTSVLTVSNLSALSSKTVSFDVVGTTSGQTVTLPEQVLLGDFSLSASPTSATVTAGQSTNYQVSVAPINGFTDSISFSCSGLPAQSYCTFSPTVLTPNGQTSSVETVTIDTTASSIAPPASPDSSPGAPWTQLVWWALVLAILLLLAAWSRAPRRRKVLLPLLVALLLVASVSCGGGGGAGGSGTGGGSSGGVAGTPTGTYTVTVTGSYGATLSHSVNLTLTVQ